MYGEETVTIGIRIPKSLKEKYSNLPKEYKAFIRDVVVQLIKMSDRIDIDAKTIRIPLEKREFVIEIVPIEKRIVVPLLTSVNQKDERGNVDA